MDDKLIVVEDGINTSYIDALLVGLFYTPSCIFNLLLNCDPDDKNFLYLQEQIRVNFIGVIRDGGFVPAEVINDIRLYMSVNGWKNDEIIESHNIVDLFSFLLEKINLIYVETTTENTDQLEKNLFIPLNPFNDDTSATKLFETWINKENRILNNIPQIIPLYINRIGINPVKIDIMKKIKISNDHNITWSIHCVICYDHKSHQYYTLLWTVTKWLVFNNSSVPSLTEVKMNDTCLIDKISRECVFLVYRYEYL